MVLILLGMALFIIKSVERFNPPMFGPSNYLMWGALVFAAGAICNLIQFISLDESGIFGSNLVKFGSFLLFGGTYFMHLAASQSWHCLDSQLVFNFPAITTFRTTPFSARIAEWTAALMTCGSFLMVLATFLFIDYKRKVLIVVGSILMAVGYAGIALVVGLNRTIPHLDFCFFVTVNAIAALIYSNAFYLDGTALQTGASLLGCLASLSMTIWSCHYVVDQFLSPGNFLIIASLFSTAGYFCVFISSFSQRDHSFSSVCAVHDCVAVAQLGYIWLFLASVTYFLFFVTVLDVCKYFEVYKSNNEDEDNFSNDYGIFTLIYKFLFPKPINKPANDGVQMRSMSKVRASSQSSVDSETVAGAYDREAISFDLDQLKAGYHRGVASNTSLAADVFICGCGPIGLTVLNEIAQRGTTVIGVDTRANVPPDPRFFNLNAPCVEGLKRLGVLDRIFARSIPQDFGHGSVLSTGMAHSETVVIASCHGPSRGQQMKLGHKQAYSAASKVFGSRWAEQAGQRCMQGVQEKCLREIAEEKPNARVMYQWECLEFAQDPSSEFVFSKIKHVSTDEIIHVRSKFIVGCDGPSSFVSKVVGAKFDGFVNLGQTRTVHFKAPTLLDKVKVKLGEALFYQVCRPGFGVGYFVLNDIGLAQWAFFLIGLVDGRMPRDLSREEMTVVLADFIGPDIPFVTMSDQPWYWNWFFARKLRFGRAFLVGDAAHSWPTFGNVGGNTGYLDAQNLGWKLSAVCKGWAHPNMLDTYDLERREAGLRTTMIVLNFAPARQQVIRAAAAATNSWLWWTISYRWVFANSGAHAFNHMMTEGISFGLRYRSHIVYVNEELQGPEPVESTPNLYHPHVVSGGRIPHLRFTDNLSINDLIAIDGYTLLVIDPSGTVQPPSSLHLPDACHCCGHAKEVVVAEIEASFAKFGVPLTVVDLRNRLSEIVFAAGDSSAHLKEMYLKQKLVLVRPDLYVVWHMAQVGGKVLQMSEIAAVTNVARSRVVGAAREYFVRGAYSSERWLTRRFLTKIGSYRTLHPTAFYVQNQDKSDVMAMVKRAKDAHFEVKTKPVPVNQTFNVTASTGTEQNVGGVAGGGGMNPLQARV